MSVILVVEPDASYGESIASALRSSGWQVEVAPDREAALASAELAQPSLVLGSGNLPQAREFFARFSRRHGGPGAVVLLPVTVAGVTSAADYEADDILPKPFSEDVLQQLVRRCLEGGAEGGEKESTRLSSAEIFGDVLEEVQQEAEQERKKRATAPVDEEVERKLEETLSGVLTADKLTRSAPPKPARGAPQEPALEQGSEATRRDAAEKEIDDLLDRTLSSLEIPIRPARARSRAARSPVPGIPKIEEMEISDLLPSEEGEEEEAGSEEAGEEAVAMPVTIPEPQAAQVHPAEGDSLVGGLEFGEYTLLERIATGGMAEVWKARRRGVEGFQKTVAIKKILSHLTGNPDFVTMFIDEAKLAAQLSHNHITQIYDLGKVGEDFYIAMEYVEGKDLRTILTAGRHLKSPIPMDLALLVASRLASALDYAHRLKDFEGRDLGLVHRDVSPQNVLVGFEGEIKLCDFGIVKAVVKASTTQMGALKGKLQYMSPEQAWGRAVDGRSDIFSLGSVLFELLTGRRLFSGDSEIAVLDAVRECQHPRPREVDPGIPEEVEGILDRALAKEPADRFQTAGDLAREIEQLLAKLQLSPGPAELGTFLRRLFHGESEDSEEAPHTATLEPSDAGAEAGEDAGERSGSFEIELPAPPAEEGSEVREAEDAEEDAEERDEKSTGRKGLWTVAAIVALLLLALGWWYWSRRQAPGGSTDAPAIVSPPAGEVAARAPEAQAPPASETDAASREPAAESFAGDPAADGEQGDPAELPEDLEQRVEEALRRRAERLQQDFEQERERLQQELATAREAAAEEAPEVPASEGGGGRSGS